MIDIQSQNEWQYRDEKLGILKPWLVKSFLDELDTWDLKDKKLFEFGLGASSVYWSRKCRMVYGVDSNPEYYDAVWDCLWGKGDINVMSTSLHTEKYNYISSVYLAHPYDIIIVDGEPVEWRDDCIKAALKCLNTDGVLIIDNYNQKDVYIPSNEIVELINKYDYKIFHQTGHPDWKTLVVYNK